MFMTNLILATDAYKFTHHLQYPEGLDNLYSYGEARKGGKYPTTSWVGMQALIQDYLMKEITTADIDEAEEQAKTVFGTEYYFNREVWEKVVDLGYLPIKIKSLPEGLEVPEGNALFTLESTEKWFATTLNALETVLMHVWYPTTIATNAMYIKKGLKLLFDQTSDAKDIEFAISLAVNDFGLRGATSLQSACLGGLGVLTHFRGSDNMIADKYIRDNYNYKGRAMSVWATEHSVATSFGEGIGEIEYLKAQLDRSDENSIISIVIDSYDTFNFVEDVVGVQLKDRIKNRIGRVVLRPDSGDPKEQVLGILQRLENIFGVTVNSKGFKTINYNVGVIQGDGMYLESILDLYNHIIEHEYSVDNLVVGSGGGLLQEGMTRDTQRFAIKASYGEIKGVPFNIQKKPKTDMTKVSKTGRLKVILNSNNEIETVSETTWGIDLLETIYDNGKTYFKDFDKVLERASSY